MKYATPSQINAMFSKFVADIETAVEKAALASTKAAAAAAAAEAAAASKTESVEAKTAAAASAAAAAASAAEANAALASAVKKAGDEMRTLAEALTQHDQRLLTIERTLKRLMSGRLTVPHLSVDKLDVWKENNIVQKGMGAPKTIPLDAGRLYVDVENDILYKSKNNSTVGDWSNK